VPWFALLNRGGRGFVQGADRQQTTLLPECLGDWVGLFARSMGSSMRWNSATSSSMASIRQRPAGPRVSSFADAQTQPSPIEPAAGGRGWPQSRSDVAAGTARPDHKTISDFRKDDGPAIGKVCASSCGARWACWRRPALFIDGSKFKAVNSRDNNFTQGKIQRRQKRIEESMVRYMSQLDTADCRTAAGRAVGSGAADQDMA
jgi:hypothetical protein